MTKPVAEITLAIGSSPFVSVESSLRARRGRRREDDEVTTTRGRRQCSGTRPWQRNAVYFDHGNARAGEGVRRCPATTATIAAAAFTIAAAAFTIAATTYTIASTYSWRVAMHEHMSVGGLRGV